MRWNVFSHPWIFQLIITLRFEYFRNAQNFSSPYRWPEQKRERLKFKTLTNLWRQHGKWETESDLTYKPIQVLSTKKKRSLKPDVIKLSSYQWRNRWGTSYFPINSRYPPLNNENNRVERWTTRSNKTTTWGHQTARSKHRFQLSRLQQWN